MSDAKKICEYWSNDSGKIYQDYAGDSDDIIKTAKLDIAEMAALVESQAKEIETQKSWLKNAEAKENNYDNLRKGFDLAIKALMEEMESAKIWGQHGTVKHIKDVLSYIRSVSGGESISAPDGTSK